MFCSKCGTPIPPGNKFCTNCGQPIEEEEQNNTSQQSDGSLWYNSGNSSNNLSYSGGFEDLSSLYSDIITDGYDLKNDSSVNP